MKYRIVEIKEPFRRTKFRVQRKTLCFWLTEYVNSLPVEFETMAGARKWIEEAQIGKAVRIHE